jgi:hypothetical protein
MDTALDRAKVEQLLVVVAAAEEVVAEVNEGELAQYLALKCPQDLPGGAPACSSPRPQS